MSETICATPSETRQHGFRFGSQMTEAAVILLQGELGAGKTEWVKGLAEGLGSKLEVTSPTFTLAHEYSGGRLHVYHWDLYRLESDTDWSVIDFFSHVRSNSVTVVEWPERYPDTWPHNSVLVRVEVLDDETRKISIQLPNE